MKIIVRFKVIGFFLCCLLVKQVEAQSFATSPSSQISSVQTAQNSTAQNSVTNYSAGIRPIINESTEIMFRADSFISPDYQSTSEKSFGFIGAHYNNLEKFDGISTNTVRLNTDITAMVSPQDTLLSYLNIKQFYSDVYGLTIGRKIIAWSELDERWHLGFYQPQFRWNPLMPESQGLTGFFIDLNNEDQTALVGLRFFGSFIFLPDQGANFQIKNGSFQSVSPWFPQMPTQIQFDMKGNVINDIHWNIHQPEMQNVLFNSSYAAQIYYGKSSYEGFFAQAALAFKPVNQLALAAQTATLPTSVTNVEITPYIYFHTLTSLDLKYSFSKLFVGTSLLLERPSYIDNIPKDSNYRDFPNQQLVSSEVGYKDKNFEATFALLTVSADKGTVVGPQSNQLGSYLPARMPFGDSAKINLKYAMSNSYARNLKFLLEAQQGLQNEYESWVLGVGSDFRRNWKWNSNIILIRSNEINVAQSGAPNLYQQFQNNDLLSIGVSYVY